MRQPPVEGVDGTLADSVRALAAGDFTDIADRFAAAGFGVRLPARGILQITASGQSPKRLSLLLSVGVHGDETAPIEMLGQLLAALALAPHALAVDLMVVVGNLEAIAQGRRFLDADLNRMFGNRLQRGALQASGEAARADLIMRATAAFFAPPGGDKWHLDLHTAIRPSLYPTFAIVPDVIADAAKRALVTWLGGAGVGAVILNSKLAPTYSAYSATQFCATSCTAELGQVGALGKNDLSAFAVTQAALDALLRSGQTLAFRRSVPHVFRVVQELVKQSDDFRMAFDQATQNFTPLEPGIVVARDGDMVLRVGAATEYVVFPNPAVGVGQRAGLMVVRQE
jgi:succinylglutamate desuccinylase